MTGSTDAAGAPRPPDAPPSPDLALGPTVRDAEGVGWRLRPARDVPALMLAVAVAMAALVEVPPPPCLPDCVAPPMNALDRLAVGGFAAGPLVAANAALVALAVWLLALNLRLARGRDRLRGLFVQVLAVAITQAIVQLTKFAVDRAAPFVYVQGTPAAALASPDAARSFISGHTATAFVLATLVVVLARRHRANTTLLRVSVVAATVLALAVGPLKVAAGYHYWTDVIAGALVGAALGVLVPALHLRRHPCRRGEPIDAA